MATIGPSGTIPTRPGTVYLGKYSVSRETLDETQNSGQLVDFKEPPKSARSIRATIRRAWTKPLEEQKPATAITRHHKFRRWLNSPEKEFTCSWSEYDENLNGELHRLRDLGEWGDLEDGSYRSTNCETFEPSTNNESPYPSNPNNNSGDESGFEMFSKMFLDSNSGATLSENAPQFSQPPKSNQSTRSRSSYKKKFDILRKFRFRLHRSRMRNEFTLTDKYLGSDENIERCLQDMDMMPFDLTAPSTAGNESKSDKQQVSGALSDKSTMVEGAFSPGALHVTKLRKNGNSYDIEQEELGIEKYVL
ncbi:LANO_0F16908g1_1 [Lachancea nothofagi CBS 11611]|uniref:LANO_0F16908g1_1 n=1 Tax=Lachancea nothofagi CBS 11611 TaxID=1266666 RepID=A0A1G4KD42_9SACH|nr:LANO_0F16908g1_1 [Lachancea nothofagi CBS 11611]